jgi:hypothetical protein
MLEQQVARPVEMWLSEAAISTSVPLVAPPTPLSYVHGRKDGRTGALRRHFCQAVSNSCADTRLGAWKPVSVRDRVDPIPNNLTWYAAVREPRCLSGVSTAPVPPHTRGGHIDSIGHPQSNTLRTGTRHRTHRQPPRATTMLHTQIKHVRQIKHGLKTCDESGLVSRVGSSHKSWASLQQRRRLP